MSDDVLLIVAMANKCRAVISERGKTEPDQPPSLRPAHLLWMCNEIVAHRNDWPATRIHRWIGFVQAGLVAGRILNLAEVKAMFDEAKNAYGPPDQDLLDHLDPELSFRLDIGGQG